MANHAVFRCRSLQFQSVKGPLLSEKTDRNSIDASTAVKKDARGRSLLTKDSNEGSIQFRQSIIIDIGEMK